MQILDQKLNHIPSRYHYRRGKSPHYNDIFRYFQLLTTNIASFQNKT